jgi:hypothetical protein
MSTENHGADSCLAAWVNVVDYYWQRVVIAEVDRVRLRGELVRDLAQSLAEGASVDDLIALDPAEFAAEVAAADGIEARSLRPDPEITDRSLVGTVLAGATGGAVLALLTVYPLGIWLMNQSSADHEQQGWVALGLHVIAASVCLTAAMVAVWWRFRFRGQVRRTLALTGGLFALGGLVSVAPTVALAKALNYNSDPATVVVEIAIVVGSCSLGILAARRLLTGGEHKAVSA